MEQLQAVVENRTGFCLDPRTKLLLMAVVATAEFLYSHTAFMIAVAMIPFVLLLTNRQYKTATVFFCLFAAGLFVQAIQNSVQFPMIVNMLVLLPPPISAFGCEHIVRNLQFSTFPQGDANRIVAVVLTSQQYASYNARKFL